MRLDKFLDSKGTNQPYFQLQDQKCFSFLKLTFTHFPRRSLNSMQIRCKFGLLGQGKGQFNSTHGFCPGLEEEIIVADTNNHRIQVLGRLHET